MLVSLLILRFLCRLTIYNGATAVTGIPNEGAHCKSGIMVRRKEKSSMPRKRALFKRSSASLTLYQDFTPLLVLAHLDAESLPLAHGTADGAHLVRVSAI